MKHIKHTKTASFITSLVILGFLGVPLEASALSILGSAQQETIAEAQSSSGNTATSKSTVNSTTGINAGLGKGSTSGAASTSVNANLSTDSNATQTTPEQTSNTDTGSDSPFSAIVVTQGSLSKDISADSTASIQSASTVESNANLSSYIEGIVSQDKNVSKVSVESEEMSLWYKQPARFLGIIPGHIDAKATVQADGSVTIDYPWYAFLAKVKHTDLESNLGARISAVMKNSVEANGNARASFTARDRARIIEEMRNALRDASSTTRVQSNATVNTTANGNANANGQGKITPQNQ